MGATIGDLLPLGIGIAISPVPVTFLSPVFQTAVISALGVILGISLTLLARALLVDIDPDTPWVGHLTRRPSSGAAPPEEADQDTAADEVRAEERAGPAAADADR